MRNDSLFEYVKDNYTNFISLIDGKNYFFRATMYNPDGIAVDIQKSAIKELYIANNVWNPFMDGYIIIKNDEDIIERFKNDPSQKEFFPDFSVLRGYRTRGDARDLLLLTIVPIINNSNPFDVSNEKFNKEFAFRYIFALENEDNVSDKEGKCKKYDLIDYDQEFFQERQSFLSSSRFVDGEISNLSNEDRATYTGKLLKNIIADILGRDSIATDINKDIETTPYFENGISKIFYSSPITNTVMDDITYIADLHVSADSQNSFSFLDKDKWSGEYSLESMASKFKKAYIKGFPYDQGGEYFIENLTITGGQSTSNVSLNDIRKPLQALELGETSDIREVNFFNSPGGIWQQKIKSTFVHQYDFDEKKFSINGSDGNILNVKADFKEMYVDTMKGKDQLPAANFITNITQKLNYASKNVFATYPKFESYSHLSFGRNQLLRDALALNLGVEIIVGGSMHRDTSKFISVDRRGEYIDNDFDNKFLGIYYIIGIEYHFIDDTDFVNKIIAVKTYDFTDLKFNENVL
jgi:hypothetical protein